MNKKQGKNRVVNRPGEIEKLIACQLVFPIKKLEKWDGRNYPEYEEHVMILENNNVHFEMEMVTPDGYHFRVDSLQHALQAAVDHARYKLPAKIDEVADLFPGDVVQSYIKEVGEKMFFRKIREHAIKIVKSDVHRAWKRPMLRS